MSTLATKNARLGDSHFGDNHFGEKQLDKYQGFVAFYFFKGSTAYKTSY